MPIMQREWKVKWTFYHAHTIMRNKNKSYLGGTWQLFFVELDDDKRSMLTTFS